MKVRKAVTLVVIALGVGAAFTEVFGRAPGEVQVIDVSAKKYEFAPAEIHVKVGARVQIKLHPTDKTHGIKLQPNSEGSNPQGPAGLRFIGQSSIHAGKNEEAVLEFVAERAGTYLFECSKFCGLGHKGMRGKLVVE